MTAIPTAPGTPSPSLVEQLRAELTRRPPFEHMAREHVERFISTAMQAYFAPDETVLAPQQGVVTHLMYVRQGSVTDRRQMFFANRVGRGG